MSHTRNLGCTCANEFNKLPWGAFIGAGALNRVNMVMEFSGLNHQCLPLNIQIPTTVGILTFMSMINFMLSLVVRIASVR